MLTASRVGLIFNMPGQVDLSRQKPSQDFVKSHETIRYLIIDQNLRGKLSAPSLYLMASDMALSIFSNPFWNAFCFSQPEVALVLFKPMTRPNIGFIPIQ